MSTRTKTKPKKRARAREPRCRVCGCTKMRACPNGCSWRAAALCSSCADVLDFVTGEIVSWLEDRVNDPARASRGIARAVRAWLRERRGVR